jgi:16S rRNA (guanine527-N7)-methyltransferase
MFHVEQGWASALSSGARELHISLDDEHISKFEQYLQNLKAWNAKINLTSITDNREIAIKHFLDSLICTRVLISGSLLDVGSGAGFPGLPLKIFRPDLEVTLLEPNRKKTAFLHHVIGTLRLRDIVVVPQRVEEFAEDESTGRFANLATRALNIQPLLQQLHSLVAPEGRLILCRSQHLEPASRLAPFEVMHEVSYSLPHGLGERVLSVLRTKA